MNAKPENDAKRLARLAAVQGLYRIALAQHAAADVIRDFYANPASFRHESEGPDVSGADAELFGAIVGGVTKDAASLDEMIAGALDPRFSPERLEVLLRAILRAGAWELHSHASIPAGIIINDYVDIAHAFFGAKEPGLVNAVLDKIGKNVRGS
jgi:N utilization substance protein B